ncbi:SCO family protein [Sporosarcina thermotolerans]|uniref:SCO family protein n=1 Tax=Sporosarcina thermotolerans TaxID=633404 RepID=A0AAW9AD68_9BACL|nr:SCO family protein [Sporosarcina thermotolerans]MDW0117086.1 SCO family protein [Sporosarcina thermotolerans]WHT47820.1 SCO family protein [Sporosarcina thermotolerans]
MRPINLVHFLVLILLLSACGTSQQTGRQVTSFSFTDQNGNSFGTEQLDGKVWIADFIFIGCTTVCPQMTSEMANLQTAFKEKGLEVEFVSFTVNPNIDSPTILKDYISQFTDDESNWHLLTGYSQETIESLALNQFQTIVQKPKTSSQVIHGTNFYIVNQDGLIVNEFNYVEENFVEQVVDQVTKLLK